MKYFADFVEALASLAWPAVLVFIFWKVFPEVRRMFESREFTFKFGDTELTVQNSTDQLFRLISDLQNKVALLESGPPAGSPDASEPAQYVRGESRLILWVDDRPGANVFERAKFQKDGFNILQSISTADALQKIQQFIKPDIIISDMGRTENGVVVPDAGLVLLRSIRKYDTRIPFLIYTNTLTASTFRQKAIDSGANGITGSPSSLIEYVARVRAPAAP